VVAPPGISAAEQAALTDRVRRLVASPSWRETLARTGWTDAYLDGPAFRQFLLAEQARVHAVIDRLAQQAGAPAGATWQPTARTAPITALLACVALAAGRWWQRRGAAGKAASPARLTSVVGILAVLGLQAVAMPLVGFVPLAAVVFATTSQALGSRRPLRDAAIGALFAGALAVLFAWGLDVPLPRGRVLP
jgi:hypothetical protein